MARLSEMVEQNKDVQVVLHGDHAEQAVIVVDSKQYGLKPLIQKW